MKDALFLRDEQIKDIIELILFAYRDTFSEWDNLITESIKTLLTSHKEQVDSEDS